MRDRKDPFMAKLLFQDTTVNHHCFYRVFSWAKSVILDRVLVGVFEKVTKLRNSINLMNFRETSDNFHKFTEFS